MIKDENYKIGKDILIPKLGFGTWRIPNDEADVAVKNAILLGYKRIDTAQAYENEEGVGKGIKASGKDRKELFIATKVRAEYKTYEEAKNSIDESLKKLGLSYLDQVIIHAPQPWNEFRGEKRYFQENREVWRALEDAYLEGKVRFIGVSNFLVDDIENLLFNCRIKPIVNQIILHIGNTNLPLVDFCKKNNILVEAYSPIAHGEALKDDRIVKRAEKYKVTPAKLCIRYVLQLGAVALPKSSTLEHRKENRDVDFPMDDADREKLKKWKDFSGYGEFGYFPVFGDKNRA